MASWTTTFAQQLCSAVDLSCTSNTSNTSNTTNIHDVSAVRSRLQRGISALIACYTRLAECTETDAKSDAKSIQKLQLSLKLITPVSQTSPLSCSVHQSVLRAMFAAANDLSWHVECLLVEDGFPLSSDAVYRALLAIIDTILLSWPSSSILSSLQDQSGEAGEILATDNEAAILADLGAELAEVALWRRGALRFMHTSTRVASKNITPSDLLDAVSKGTRDLQLVLIQRDGTRDAQIAPQENIVYGTGGKDVQDMVTEKIYSDTHLLSVAYAAELYYYGWKNASDISSEITTQYAQNAVRLFDKYVRIVEGPMHGAGWTTDKARQCLSELRGSPRPSRARGEIGLP
eukprot:TRINITY_DN9011_c0_g2_i1.p1 TRINITY_DN9011_c0_g2~~TRINITY_DN9011_c0_g2_i1.p1  ORF type:complete len:347 (-),score=66.60 TRINITY_DN9011_c0_g2_i1:954-1994(-)